MTVTLYQYSHCPYCIRVRMALGFLMVPHELKEVAYCDEKTPTSLIGKKMLPILVDHQGVAMGESLDIIAKLDPEMRLGNPKTIGTEAISEKLTEIWSLIGYLNMPYFAFAPEFTPEDRAYFVKKKLSKYGPFQELVKRRKEFEGHLLEKIESLQKDLKPFYQSQSFSLNDILLAAHFWGLYLVPEFYFPEKFHLYLQEVKKLTHFDYLTESYAQGFKEL